MQDYKYVQRALTGGSSVIGQSGELVAQNFSEFMSYLNEQYLSQGYEVQSTTLLRYVAPGDAGASVVEYGYHLVKELKKSKE